MTDLFDIEIERQWRWLKKDFRYHKATIQRFGDVETLVWKQPGTSCMQMNFTLFKGILSVSGDMGELIVENRGGCVEGWGGLDDFGYYFLQKIRMCNEGMELSDFDHQGAEETFKKELKESLVECGEFEEKTIKNIMDYVDSELLYALPEPYDRNSFISGIYNSLDTNDKEGQIIYNHILEDGYNCPTGVIKYKIKAVWLALQMAYRQKNIHYNKPIAVLKN